MVNLVECNVFFQREDEKKYLDSENILMQAWSPLTAGQSRLFENETLLQIAHNHNKTVAQIVLRWLVQRGIVPIVKSSNPVRMKENLDIFDFEISQCEMDEIKKLDTGKTCFIPRNTGEISIGGNPAKTILKTASNLVKKYNGVKFNFYSGDAEDVCERLEHGSLDFAILLKPVDSVKYDYISLPDGSEWGILMSSDCKLAKQQFITKENLKYLPLILHRRIGLQRAIAKWADINLEDLNIVASYNVVQGSPISFVESGLGYFLTTKDLIEKSLNDNVCFIPLKPKLATKYALVWKRYPIFTKPANAFLEEIKSILK